MVTVAKTISQASTHMVIAFAVTYGVTGSVAFGGLAALIEPVINVALLPWHERGWRQIRRAVRAARVNYGALAAEKISQTGMHMIVAFAVMFWATGSLAFGGIAAVLEPVCNVLVLPLHDRFWENLRARLAGPVGTVRMA